MGVSHAGIVIQLSDDGRGITVTWPFIGGEGKQDGSWENLSLYKCPM